MGFFFWRIFFFFGIKLYVGLDHEELLLVVAATSTHSWAKRGGNRLVFQSGVSKHPEMKVIAHDLTSLPFHWILKQACDLK
jgi:hypothetical protein